MQNSEALRVIFYFIFILLTWTGCGDASRLCSNEGTCLKHSHWFGKRHKMDAFTKLGNLLSELHVPHKQCLAGIIYAFSASFTSIWPYFPQFYCTPNKACLLCATPTDIYRVQFPGFPKIVYSNGVFCFNICTHM